jgi:hypothetical protein
MDGVSLTAPPLAPPMPLDGSAVAPLMFLEHKKKTFFL